MREGHRFRPEIQGLRGLAVALVVVFHLWPDVLPGGYVGVDVFFVISGYLITALLAQAAMRDGRISPVAFYSRRIRRLLPAATLVLLATLCGTLVFLSKARWEETANQIIASALYVQNWRLASIAVSYLDADSLPSPVQHYWSLSIEEQFYIVWPLLMIAVIWLARRWGLPLRRSLTAALSLVFAGSLIASVVLTRMDPAQAYFVTQTRIWELALGGLLALTAHRFRLTVLTGQSLAIAGVAGIFASALLFSASTPFPGAYALLPTLGTALVILAGEAEFGRFRWLDSKLLGFIGDRSYSIYLWHWPLLVLFLGMGYSISLVSGAALIAVTMALSDLSYRYVEQRYRRAKAWAVWEPLGYGTLAVLACVAAAGGFIYSLRTETIDTTLIGTSSYPGPAALLSDTPVPDGVNLLPPLARLKRDLPIAYVSKCHQEKGAEPTRCSLGDPAGVKTIVLVGDSHAAQWIPALDKIAMDRKTKLITFTKSACPFSRVPVVAHGKADLPCAQWRENVLSEIIKLKPYLIFTSQSNYGIVPQQSMIDGLRSVWSKLTETGSQIVVIRNTPYIKFDPGDCLKATPTKCFTKRNEVESNNILALAAKSQNALFVDMTDAICGPLLCPAVVGNIIVWRDHHHLTASYSLALAPYLALRAGL